VKALRSSEKIGRVAAACLIGTEDEIVIVSAKGVVIRLSARNVPLMSRNTQGVRLINLDDAVASLARIMGDGPVLAREDNTVLSEDTVSQGERTR
jgi:DNA gyrase subunit A